MTHQLRIARPVSNLELTRTMYCQGLGLRVLDSFVDHERFDAIMLGTPGAEYHFEFTYCRSHPVTPAPTAEDLVVFYLPSLTEWQTRRESMLAAGFKRVASFNPYWEVHGCTFEDADGYRVVLQNAEWRSVQEP